MPPALAPHRARSLAAAGPARRRRASARPPRAARGDGDFGARDATSAELDSNFSDKVLGNWDTSHIIRGPAGLNKLVGLHTKTITPEAAAALLSPADATRLRQQAAGWRMDSDAATGAPATLNRTWAAKDGAAAAALLARLHETATGEGHAIAKGVAEGGTVAVDLSTPAVGGLSEADFILAAKLNEVDYADLAAPKKQRFWA